MTARMRIDPETGNWRLVARFRSVQRCYGCKSVLSAGAFGPSRILKRDYECRRCHAMRKARARLYARASRSATT